MYSARTELGRRERFGTSGLLYRANKLMFDRSTRTLWNSLTGESAAGSLAARATRLEALPVTVTTWGAWRRAHPGSTVVVLSPAFGSRWGFDYQPGAADRHRAGVRFPVWQKSSRLDARAEVLGLRVGKWVKAYPVDQVVARGVVNDRLGEIAVVVIAESESDGLRVFRRGTHTLRRLGPGQLIDDTGRVWTQTENALVATGADGEPALERLPAQLAFWFGWFGFFPETEIYEPPAATSG